MDDGDRLRAYFISGNPFLDIARGTATVSHLQYSQRLCIQLSLRVTRCRLLQASCWAESSSHMPGEQSSPSATAVEGLGRLVCPMCRGFNQLRKWPGEFHEHRGAIVNQRKTDV